MAKPPGTSPTRRGPRAMDLLDEAIALLRSTPLSLFFIYYLGAAPFGLGMLYFDYEMTENVHAEDRLAPLALGLAGLYLWMKTCQAVFARRLLERLEGGDPQPWTPARWFNTAIVQACFAGVFLILYPLALIAAVPFGWVNAFIHNVSILGTGPRTTLSETASEAASLSGLWPRQNHILLGLQFIALLVLLLDIGILLALIPALLNMFLGLSTVFTQNESALASAGFSLDIAVVCFLIMNPVNKALYVLRCFYGRSRLDGADLRASLRFHERERARDFSLGRLALLLGGILVLGALPLQAADNTPHPMVPAINAWPKTPPPAPLGADTLDQAIQKTLQNEEYAWRLPRDVVVDDNSLSARVMRSLVHFRDYIDRKIGHVVSAILDWILDRDHKHDPSSDKPSFAKSIPWRLVFFLLTIIVVAVLSVIFLRHYRRRPPAPTGSLASASVATAVDLASEDVRADQLPEDSWLALAQELATRGELRLALRAFYLATLSILAHSELIRLGPAKSNRDYLVEMTRRLRGDVEAVPVFRDSIHLFEASWYGTHAVTDQVLEKIRNNHQTVRGHVAA